MTFRSGPYPEIIAHRGGSLLRPENTLLAFEHARALGVRTLEMDLHLTRDGHIVCHHDARVDRTTNGQGALAELDLSAVAALDAGYHFSPDGHTHPHRGQGVRIPTLAEVFDACPDSTFILEMKPRGPALAHALERFLSERSAHDRVCVGSFHDATLAYYRHIAGPSVRTSAGQHGIFAFWAFGRLRRGLSGLSRLVPREQAPCPMMQIPPVHRGLTILDPEFVARCHALGIEIHAWTINDAAEMQRLLNLGVDALITDIPSVAIEILDARRASNPLRSGR